MNDMTEYETGAVRDTGGKGRTDLLPMCALLRVSKHMEDALTHYPERNWEKGMPMHNMIDSAFRHLMKYVDGWTDEDHLCAAATNLLMAMWMEEKRPEMRDIPTREAELSPMPLRDTGRGLPCAQAPKANENAPKKTKAKERPKKTQKEVCKYYTEDGRCFGTKDCDPCLSKGDKSRCKR